LSAAVTTDTQAHSITSSATVYRVTLCHGGTGEVLGVVLNCSESIPMSQMGQVRRCWPRPPTVRFYFISRLPFSENRRIADDKNVNGSRTWLAVWHAKVVIRKQVLQS
jgi:hypothetical protein